MAFNYSPKPIIDNSLVVYLDAANPKSFVSGSTTWTDISRGGNTGALTNGPTYNGANGGNLVFNGSTGYIDLGNSIVNLTTQLTINFWGKINGSPTDGILITKGEHDFSNSANFGFQITPSLCLRFYARVSNQSYIVIDSNINIRDNNISNYVVTYNSGIVIFYKNGMLFSTHSFGLSSLPATTGPLYLGKLKGYSGYYPGNIYSIQLYNRALSATEILQNYNALKGRFGLR